ncbi:trypco2 family protein [Streptomyces sp. 900116325]
MDIELADPVAGSRDELLTAAARGAGQDLVFDVGTIELELAVELRTDAKSKAGFKAVWFPGSRGGSVTGRDASGELSR